jgi:hypothetical protein
MLCVKAGHVDALDHARDGALTVEWKDGLPWTLLASSKLSAVIQPSSRTGENSPYGMPAAETQSHRPPAADELKPISGQHASTLTQPARSKARQSLPTPSIPSGL